MSYKESSSQTNLVRSIEVAALLAAVLLVGSNAFVLSPILSDVASGLGTEPFRVAWAISASGAATAVSALTLAGLVDRFPAGRVLGAAALLLALAQAAGAASQNWIWLCLSQALAGVAVGIILPGAYATAAATAEPGREAARLGFVLTGWALSLVFAVPLAALVAEQFGWRSVYVILAGLSAVVGVGLFAGLRGVRAGSAAPTAPLRALRLPNVALLLAVMFAFMTAFYGSFAFLGEGVRAAFGLTAKGTGVFVLAYGLGFGLAGIVLGVAPPKISRVYVLLVLFGLASSYWAWRFALSSPTAAFGATVIWGIFNQLGVNALVVSMNRRAAEARGAVMGLNSAVTYSAVFAGPVVMGQVYAGSGFVAVTGLAAVLILVGAAVSWKALQPAA
ncbi:MFS transporter [Amorphus orientalis]|uniref:MFS family arabinose efflux permease n=1 Tax=Amorphus orientalis TaxID=649198 RepID=A0AAE3VNX1_9HYPH|nr:MFS transporter [Amorphus orientalis]MDQ0316104.1 putative MFS family arabinose efflux permease [Amorphus orientalis]